MVVPICRSWICGVYSSDWRPGPTKADGGLISTRVLSWCLVGRHSVGSRFSLSRTFVLPFWFLFSPRRFYTLYKSSAVITSSNHYCLLQKFCIKNGEYYQVSNNWVRQLCLWHLYDTPLRPLPIGLWSLQFFWKCWTVNSADAIECLTVKSFSEVATLNVWSLVERKCFLAGFTGFIPIDVGCFLHVCIKVDFAPWCIIL